MGEAPARLLDDFGRRSVVMRTPVRRVVVLVGIEVQLRIFFIETMRLADGLTEIELARAKAQMKAGLLMSLESTGARCEQMAQHMLIYGTPFDPADLVRRVEAVDNAAIGRVGNSPITYELDGRQYVLVAGGSALYAWSLPVSSKVTQR